jgi:hypothetical protein
MIFDLLTVFSGAKARLVLQRLAVSGRHCSVFASVTTFSALAAPDAAEKLNVTDAASGRVVTAA